MKKPKEQETYDIDIQACSTMDCTGLIPAPPRNQAEQDSYEELYPYLTHALPKSDQKDVR